MTSKCCEEFHKQYLAIGVVSYCQISIPIAYILALLLHYSFGLFMQIPKFLKDNSYSSLNLEKTGKRKVYLLEFGLGGWPFIVEAWYWFCLNDQVLSQLFNGSIILFLYRLLLDKQQRYLTNSKHGYTST